MLALTWDPGVEEGLPRAACCCGGGGWGECCPAVTAVGLLREGCLPRRGACLGGAGAALTVGAVDAGVLVVTEEKASVALALVAAHGIDADLLAATVVVLTLVHI